MRQRLSETIKSPPLFARVTRRLIQLITVASVSLVIISCDNPTPLSIDIANSASEIQPLEIGQQVPSFIVNSVDGSAIKIDPDGRGRPMLIITFRGGWCPYCNFHLSELRTVIPELRDAGVDVIFLSGDRPELLFESLALETQESIADLDYSIYSDAEGFGATTLGIAFRAAEQTISRRREKGQDIDDSSMDKLGLLAVPSVFVLDSSGTVRFVYANPDYKVRLSATEVRDAALKSAASNMD